MIDDPVASALKRIDIPVIVPADVQNRIWQELAPQLGTSSRWSRLRSLGGRTFLAIGALVGLVAGPRVVLAPGDNDGARVETRAIEQAADDESRDDDVRMPPMVGGSGGGRLESLSSPLALPSAAAGSSGGAGATAASSAGSRTVEEWVAYYSDSDGTWSTYVMRGDGSSVRKVPGKRDRQVLPEWSPDGRLLALTDGDDLVLTTSDGSYSRVLAPATVDRQFVFPAWSPDGRLIAATACPSREYCAGELWIIDVSTGAGRRLAEGQGGAWHPDGKQIVYVHVPNAHTCTGERVSVAGKQLAGGLYCHGELRIVDVLTGRDRPLGERGHFPRFSSDGRTLAWERFTSEPAGIDVVVAPVDDLRRVRSLTGEGHDMSPSWTPDGRIVFYKISPAGRGSTIWVMNADGTQQRAVQPITTLGWNIVPKVVFRTVG